MVAGDSFDVRAMHARLPEALKRSIHPQFRDRTLAALLTPPSPPAQATAVIA